MKISHNLGNLIDIVGLKTLNRTLENIRTKQARIQSHYFEFQINCNKIAPNTCVKLYHDSIKLINSQYPPDQTGLLKSRNTPVHSNTDTAIPHFYNRPTHLLFCSIVGSNISIHFFAALLQILLTLPFYTSAFYVSVSVHQTRYCNRQCNAHLNQ